jgi:hypothetical protein
MYHLCETGILQNACTFVKQPTLCSSKFGVRTEWRDQWNFSATINSFTYNELLNTASRTALGPTQPPIQWVPGALSVGVKRPGREASHPPPSSAEVKE